jgi:uncharacterized protein YbjT (DUF2867 family)
MSGPFIMEPRSASPVASAAAPSSPRSTRPLLLVTGATGKVGGAVVAALRADGWPVRAVVRVRDARSAALGALGAEVVVADLFDPAQVAGAMRGAARALYVAPFDPRAARGAAAFADAARDAVGRGLEAVASLSQWLASPAHPSALTRHHYDADRAFAALADAAGLACTIVRPGFFADNYLRLIGFAAQLGVLPSLTGDSLDAPPSTEDIARVVAAALTDPAAHAGRAYRPTGPALLATRDMAAVLARVLGHPVRRAELPFWLFARAARAQGVGRAELSGVRHYAVDHRQGAFAWGAPTDDVRAVTGHAPEDFETVARRYAERPEARRARGTRGGAWADLLATPLRPAYDLDAYDRDVARRFDLAPPPAPRHAMQDPAWRATHGAPAARGGADPGVARSSATPVPGTSATRRGDAGPAGLATGAAP